MFVAMNLHQAFDLHVSCWLIVECYSEKYINTRCILFLGSLKTYKLKNDFEGSFLYQNVWRGIKWKFVYISFNRILSRPAKENWLFLKLIRIFLFFEKMQFELMLRRSGLGHDFSPNSPISPSLTTDMMFFRYSKLRFFVAGSIFKHCLKCCLRRKSFDESND